MSNKINTKPLESAIKIYISNQLPLLKNLKYKEVEVRFSHLIELMFITLETRWRCLITPSETDHQHQQINK